MGLTKDGGTGGRPSAGAWTEYGIAALLAAATVLWLLSFGPLIDAPVGDDSSFARSAEGFARTGRVVYNGWGAPMIIPQSVYGGLLIRWFGFTFRMLELSGVLLSSAAVGALYVLARSCSVSRGGALVTCCISAGWPSFVCVAPSFQTDGPSLLFLLGAQSLLVHALRAAPDSHLRLAPWPFAGFVVLTLLGGANRQILWGCGIAAMLPVALRVRDRGSRAALAAGAACIGIGAAILSRWFGQQTNALPLPVSPGLEALRADPGNALRYTGRLLSVAGLLLLPVAVLRRRPAGGRMTGAAVLPLLGVAALWVLLFWSFTRHLHWVYDDPSGRGAIVHWGVPTVGNYTTSTGPFLGVAGTTQQPPIFQMRWSVLLHAAGAAGVAALLVAVVAGLRRRGGHGAPSPDRSEDEVRITTARWALLSASLAQMAASLPWYAQGGRSFDRYLMLILPGLLIFLAPDEARPDTKAARGSVLLSWALAAFIVAGGVAFGQTYWAAMRAKTEVFRRLLATGVDPRHIDAGPEFNIDTQIVAAGVVNVPGIRNPSRVYPAGATGKGVYWFGSPFPEIDARYRLALRPDIPGGDPVVEEPVFEVRYRTLLPPFESSAGAYRLRR